MEREPLVRRRHILADIAIRNDPAEHAFPRMTMAVHKAGDDDRIRGIDHLAARLEIGANRCDLLTLNQHVAFDEIADARVHADDRSAF